VERVDESFDRKPGDDIFDPALWTVAEPSVGHATFDPMAAPRAEIALLCEDTIGELDVESARDMGYEVQRLATAIKAGRAAEKRWREICRSGAGVADPGDIRDLGHKLLKYSFALRRSAR
jgi:hypothetical protein